MQTVDILRTDLASPSEERLELAHRLVESVVEPASLKDDRLLNFRR